MGADEEGTLECLKALRRGARRALRTDARRQLMEQQFDFLGFTFGRMYSPRTGQARLALRPCWRQDPRKIVSDFARLSAGGNRIRTLGPTCDDSASSREKKEVKIVTVGPKEPSPSQRGPTIRIPFAPAASPSRQ